MRGWTERILAGLGKGVLIFLMILAAGGASSGISIRQEQWERDYGQRILQEEALCRRLLAEARLGGQFSDDLRAAVDARLPGTAEIRYVEDLDGLYLITKRGFMQLHGFLVTEESVDSMPLHAERRLLVAGRGEQIRTYLLTWGWD